MYTAPVTQQQHKPDQWKDGLTFSFSSSLFIYLLCNRAQDFKKRRAYYISCRLQKKKDNIFIAQQKTSLLSYHHILPGSLTILLYMPTFTISLCYVWSSFQLCLTAWKRNEKQYLYLPLIYKQFAWKSLANENAHENPKIPLPRLSVPVCDIILKTEISRNIPIPGNI